MTRLPASLPRWAVDPPPRLNLWFPGVSCEHPSPIDITVLGHAYGTAMCNGCGTRWYWPRASRWIR